MKETSKAQKDLSSLSANALISKGPRERVGKWGRGAQSSRHGWASFSPGHQEHLQSEMAKEFVDADGSQAESHCLHVGNQRCINLFI